MSAITLLLSLAGRSNWKQSWQGRRAKRSILCAETWTYQRWKVL